ncbi:hypothetical protein GCM10009646_68080 [Streptomyces aureus]
MAASYLRRGRPKSFRSRRGWGVAQVRLGGAGQGIGAINRVRSLSALAGELGAQYTAACEELARSAAPCATHRPCIRLRPEPVRR